MTARFVFLDISFPIETIGKNLHLSLVVGRNPGGCLFQEVR